MCHQPQKETRILEERKHKRKRLLNTSLPVTRSKPGQITYSVQLCSCWFQCSFSSLSSHPAHPTEGQDWFHLYHQKADLSSIQRLKRSQLIKESQMYQNKPKHPAQLVLLLEKKKYIPEGVGYPSQFGREMRDQSQSVSAFYLLRCYWTCSCKHSSGHTSATRTSCCLQYKAFCDYCLQCPWEAVISSTGYRQAVHEADVFQGNVAGKSNFYNSDPIFKSVGCLPFKESNSNFLIKDLLPTITSS